jgi:hypothetical protein
MASEICEGKGTNVVNAIDPEVLRVNMELRPSPQEEEDDPRDVRPIT